MRLVTFAFNVRVRLVSGTNWPAGAGDPPVQVMRISPVISVTPSIRMVGTTGTAGLQVNGRCWAHAVTAKKSRTVKRSMVTTCLNSNIRHSYASVVYTV